MYMATSTTFLRKKKYWNFNFLAIILNRMMKMFTFEL